MTEAPLFRSKSEYAYEVIKRRILSEEMAPGSVVAQDKLATDLGVSTTPLREAFRRLAAEGLVFLSSHRDARVSDLTEEEARGLYEVRLSLDPLAASLAARRRTADDVAAIEVALAALHPLSGRADWDSLIAHRAFHRAVYRAAHNAPLVSVLEGLWDKADRYRQVGLRLATPAAEDVTRVQREHGELARAVIDGEAAVAQEVMQRHIEGSLGRRAIDVLGHDRSASKSEADRTDPEVSSAR